MIEPIKFELKTDKGAILKTKNTYHTQNIQITPKLLESETITENGTYSVPEGYAGCKEVTVDIRRLDPITITENGTYPVPEGSNGYGEITVTDAFDREPRFPFEKVIELSSDWTFSTSIICPASEVGYGYNGITGDPIITSRKFSVRTYDDSIYWVTTAIEELLRFENDDDGNRVFTAYGGYWSRINEVDPTTDELFTYYVVDGEILPLCKITLIIS